MGWLPIFLLASVSAVAAGSDEVLDHFRYADAAAAGRAWVAAEGTPPVTVAETTGGNVVVLAAPFASDRNLPRAVIDRRLEFDLAVPGEFTLEVATDSPEALGEITLYFRSGEGWYGAHAAATKKGWQTLRFSKAAFRPEGSPAGWQRIDGVRIAVWRGQEKDTSLQLRRLAAVTHDIALVIPAGAGQDGKGELLTAQQSAELVAGMLSELGLGADAVDDTAVTRGALGSRRVAILAYHPQLGGAAVDALVRFVEGGGKVFACFTLPPKLGTALGFGETKFLRPERSGQFSEIRFEGAEMPGLPPAVHQSSWNIVSAQPAGHHAHVVGRWFDDAVKPTGQPALLLSDRGAFFSHIILPEDREAKKQMLAAVVGRLAPTLWKRIAEAAIARDAQVGHCHDIGELLDFVWDPVRYPHTTNPLAGHGVVTVLAKRAVERGDYAEAIQRAEAARAMAVRAYLNAAPSIKREARAMWNHSGTGAYPGDWDRTCKLLADNGFNMLLPNMLWGGLAHYPSDLLPRSATFREHGDQIAQCVAAAKKHGIEVHVWKVNFNLLTAPKDFVGKMRSEGRTQVDAHGKPLDWLCPSHPENQKLERESMLEVARKYPVAGLHFDYIRYPDREACYCDGCRQRFAADSGRPVADWPRECYSGLRKEEYNDWRCRQITMLVAAVHEGAKKLRPDLKISAAVFGGYPGCRASVAQDWPAWIKAGYLDFVCPMDYSNSDAQFAGWVESQVKLVGGRVPIYPGIGATASSSALSADRVVGQILRARGLGAGGFSIFNLDRGTAETIVPGLGLGVGRERAAVPH